uniref:Uncharacterized protein n=1 Tax=Anopheles atroparvus TaxID=41427 RepID=A0A182J3B5_ANOAO
MSTDKRLETYSSLCLVSLAPEALRELPNALRPGTGQHQQDVIAAPADLCCSFANLLKLLLLRLKGLQDGRVGAALLNLQKKGVRTRLRTRLLLLLRRNRLLLRRIRLLLRRLSLSSDDRKAVVRLYRSLFQRLLLPRGCLSRLDLLGGVSCVPLLGTFDFDQPGVQVLTLPLAFLSGKLAAENLLPQLISFLFHPGQGCRQLLDGSDVPVVLKGYGHVADDPR